MISRSPKSCRSGAAHGTSQRLSRWAVTWLAVVTAAVLGVAATSCSSDGRSRSGQGGGSVLTFGITQGFSNLDPARDGGGPQVMARALSYESLTHQMPDGSIGPGLATSWRYVGTGNMEFELTLRGDARFSDGAPVTADAVKIWFEYVAGAKGPFSSRLDIAAIETIGQQIVRLQLASPNPIIPFLLSEEFTWGSVASPNAVADPSTLGTRTIGAGPYVLDPSATVSGDHYTYKPNSYYYDKSKIKFSQVVAKVITDPSSMLQAAATGQLRVAVGDLSTAAAAADSGLNVVRVPNGWITGLVLIDTEGKLSKPLGDVRVRQALNYAIDRKTITTALAGDYGSPTAQEMTKDGRDPAYDAFFPYDPAKAKSLLADAGFANGFTLKVLTQGQWGNLGDAVARAMAKDLKAVGVTLDITEAATSSQFGAEFTTNKFPAIQLLLESLSMWELYGRLAPGNSLHPGSADPEMEKLAGEAATSPDPASYFVQMSRRLTEYAKFVPAFIADKVYFGAEDIGGLGGSVGYLKPTDWFIK